jgi:hypothetical protein
MTPKLWLMYAPPECFTRTLVTVKDMKCIRLRLVIITTDGGVTLDRSIHSLSLTGKLTVHDNKQGTLTDW